jgi:two-component system response regulator FixJ
MTNINFEASCLPAPTLTDTVFIVDDDPLVRSALEISLTLAGLKTVKFASGEQFLAQVTPEHSGCLLTDIRMPGMDGLQLQEELGRRNAAMCVIIMTGHADVPMAVRAVKAGALDILEKPFVTTALVDRVQMALALSRRKSKEVYEHSLITGRYDALSPRERDVLKLVVEGKSTKEIARALNISPRTVDGHRSHIMEKMQAENLASLIGTMATFATPMQALQSRVNFAV